MQEIIYFFRLTNDGRGFSEFRFTWWVIILAEPGVHLSDLGRRVLKQTVRRETTGNDFQTQNLT